MKKAAVREGRHPTSLIIRTEHVPTANAVHFVLSQQR
jgi:hypothetical protein